MSVVSARNRFASDKPRSVVQPGPGVAVYFMLTLMICEPLTT
jgi:hypothetical protein